MWGGLEVAVPITTWGPVALAPVGALGVGVDRVASTATAFVGSPVEETYTVVGLVVRLGVEASLPLTDHLELGFAAGVLAKTPRLVTRLPEPFTTASADLDAGSVLPWAELGLKWRVF